MSNHGQDASTSATVSQQTHDQFALLVTAVKDYAIFMLSTSGHVTTWNQGAERIKGYKADEIVGKHFSSFYPPEDVENGKPERLLSVAVQEGRVEDVGWRVRKDGSRFWADVVITALYDDAGKHQGFAKITRDLSERHRANEQFRLLVQGVQDYAIFMLDPEGYISTWNLGAQRIKGYSQSEILGKHFSVFYTPEDAAAGRPEQLLGTAKQEGRVEHEGWRVRKDGSRFWADVVITALYDEAGQLRGFAKVTRDLTERLQAEERQRAQELIARQKDVRLQEVHHRVKNNLQVISSLMSLQAQRFSDPVLADVIQEIQKRIRAISVIHEKLYQSSGNAVDFADYLQDLVSMIADGLRPRDRGIEVVLVAEPITLPMETAVPCGLIVNELLTNALKHAFPEGSGGTVSVALRTEHPELVLVVEDNGVGLRTDPMQGGDASGLGFRILAALTQQLDGTYRVFPDHPGTSIEVRFPVPNGTWQL